MQQSSLNQPCVMAVDFGQVASRYFMQADQWAKEIQISANMQ